MAYLRPRGGKAGVKKDAASKAWPIDPDQGESTETPEAQGLVAWWLDKENVLPDEFSIFNPRLVARVHRLRASAPRPWLVKRRSEISKKWWAPNEHGDK